MRKKTMISVILGALACGLLIGCSSSNEQSQSIVNENVTSEKSDEKSDDLTEIKDNISTFEFNEVTIDTENTWGSLIFTDSEFYLYDAKAGDSMYDAYTQNEKLYVSKDGSDFERSRADIPSLDIYANLLDAVAENLTYDNHTYGGSLALTEVKDSFSDYMALMEYEDEALNKDSLSFTIDVCEDEITLLIDNFYSLKYKTENDDPVELLKESILSNADTELSGIICYNPDLDEELSLNEGNISVSDDFELRIKVVDGDDERYINVADIELLEDEVKIGGKSYLLTTRSEYQKIAENEQEAARLASAKYWKEAYIGYFNTIDFQYKDFAFVDLLNDGVPEFLYKVDDVYGLCYVDANYVVHDLGTTGCITFFDPFNANMSDSLMVAGISGQDHYLLRGYNCNIYYYNNSTGTWELAFEGVVDSGWYVAGESVTVDYYEDRIEELAPMDSNKTEMSYTTYHTESVTEYIEMYEVE